MKKIFFVFIIFTFFIFAKNSLAFAVPSRPTNFVNDYTNILTNDQKKILEDKISNFEKQTTDEIAVVIIKSVDGDVVENIAQDIFTKWGIGKKDKNNGVLVLVAMDEHKTRIQTGYGVEGSLTDLATSYIQSDIMTPAFRGGDYFGGINGAVDKIISSLSGENIVPEKYKDNKNSNISWSFIFFLIFIVLRIIFIFRAKKKGKKVSWWYFGPWGGGGDGSSGGGFGGFGGGASGGGGSSGSW